MPFFVWLLIGSAVTFGLQLIPVTSLLMMIVGGGFITGGLFLAALVSILVEACLRRIPRWLVALPLLGVGVYYGVAVAQRLGASGISASFADRPSLKHVFDPSRDAMNQAGIDANYLLVRYVVPAVYDLTDNSMRRLSQNNKCEGSRAVGHPIPPSTPIGIDVPQFNASFCFQISSGDRPPSALTFEYKSVPERFAGVDVAAEGIAGYRGRRAGGVRDLPRLDKGYSHRSLAVGGMCIGRQPVGLGVRHRPCQGGSRSVAEPGRIGLRAVVAEKRTC